jgi:putative FmdB family regulatory protein
MPTYEYECTRCGLITEEFKPMSAPRRQRCPQCRSKVERLISGGAGLHFKGSGFYINDSRAKKGAAGGEKKDSPSSPSVHNTKKADKNKG